MSHVYVEPAIVDLVPPAYVEEPVIAEGAQGPLVGILTWPGTLSPGGALDAGGRPKVDCVVLMVAGQPQTRIGAHRMFVTLARGLAASGIGSLRFDCGGWGDSPGDSRPFEHSAPDIAAAAALLRRRAGPGARLVVFGLCDGASAAILATPMLRLRGIEPDALCLVNPWARNARVHGEVMLKRYYAGALLRPRSWLKLLSGRMPLRSLLAPVVLWQALRRHSAEGGMGDDLPSTLLAELRRFRGPVWTVLSGEDLTAAEVERLIATCPRWKQALEGPDDALFRLPSADHTLTEPDHWRLTISWLVARCRSIVSSQSTVFCGALALYGLVEA